MAAYRIGLKAGAVSGIITGIIFSIILSTLFYATMSNTSQSFGTSEKTIAELAGFGKTQGNSSMISAILTIIATTFGISLVAGILLGISTAAMIVITKRGPSFSMAVLILLAMSIYFSQKYETLADILKYTSSDKYLTENIKILIILTNTMPPVIFAAIEAMLLNYFWGTYTVINFAHPKQIIKERPIQTNPVNATYSANTPAQAPKPSYAQSLVKSLLSAPPPKPQMQQPSQHVSEFAQNNIPDDLKEYMFECMDKGISENEIRAMFLGYGYDSDSIDRAITEKKSGPNIVA